MLTDSRGIRVALLGPVLVEDRSGALAEPTGVLAKALLVTLAEPNGAGAGRTRGVEAIAEGVWDEDDRPRHAKAALQTLVSRLRSASADGLIASRPGGYALDVGMLETDVALAHELGRRAARSAAAGEPREAVTTLDDALALWRGEPGVDLGDAPVGRELADAAAALRLGLRELRARCLLDAGDPEGAVAELEPLVAGHPLDEHLHVTWLRALAAAGRRADALAAFAAVRTSLRDELGISPGPQLVALNAELLREHEAAAQPPAMAQPARDTRVRIGVRAAPNALIGRDADVAWVEGLLGEHRLVTILGAGGLGKTRLAQEVAGRSDAPVVVVVELASVRSDDDVVLALASTLGIREASTSARLADRAQRPDMQARLVDRLGERPTLLVLDNCEHVVEGAADWTAELLAAVPRLRVLATSRSPLAIAAEQVYALEPLSAGDVGESGSANDPGPAVLLFLERARAARPGATLPLAPIARLCERLDGLPLAIELAAARVRSLSVEQIEARLENRFALLTGGDRAAPERQRTLRAVIAWSWALLAPAERAALPRLAWFVDGFGLEAAESVLGTADALDVLEGLIDQSLLVVGEDRLGRPRYRMLETVREFGQAEQDDAAREDALDEIDRWAAGFARERYLEATSPRQLEGIAALTVEQDNLVAVLRRGIRRRGGATVFAVFGPLAYYWTARSRHSEIVGFSDAVLEATRGYHPAPELAEPATLSLAIIAGTNLAMLTMTGLRAAARLRVLAGEHLPLPRWLAELSEVLLGTPDAEAATARLGAMVSSDDPSTAMLGNVMMAQFEENDSRPEEARRYAIRAYEIATSVGDVWISALCALLLAQLASQGGRPEEALDWAVRAERGLLALDAEQDLLQLEWMTAGGLVAAGRNDEARARLEALRDDDRAMLDGLELAQVAELGLAELARIEGDQATAFALGCRVVEGFRDPSSRSSPWYLLTLATLVAGGAREGWPAETVASWAESLRRRASGLLRARPGYTDRPVLGTVAAGWSAWGIRRPDLADRALELFALAEALRARQDLPALRLVDLAVEVEAIVGAERLAEVRGRVAAMTAAERTERARDLVAAPVPSAASA
ncbi:ATP-binding protein [Agromyces sp. NPDC055661]